MLTAGPPFTSDTPVSIAYKHVQEAPTPPSQFNADVPPELEAICLLGLTKDPDTRYASADDLRAVIEDGSVPANRSSNSTKWRPYCYNRQARDAVTRDASNPQSAVGQPFEHPKARRHLTVTRRSQHQRRTNQSLGDFAGGVVNCCGGLGLFATQRICAPGSGNNDPGVVSDADSRLRVPSVVGLDWQDAENQLLR